MKYRMKTPPVVDAFQFTGDVEALHSWACERIIGFAFPSKDGAKIQSGMFTYNVPVGWWVCVDDVAVCPMFYSDAAFRAEFEEVQP